MSGAASSTLGLSVKPGTNGKLPADPPCIPFVIISKAERDAAFARRYKRPNALALYVATLRQFEGGQTYGIAAQTHGDRHRVQYWLRKAAAELGLELRFAPGKVGDTKVICELA